ncbi:MAG: hypothetical protein FWD93_04735, partial [Coriobacteriia bacterium]|nr:hypothetical protein [Coriobacteriia bacterium]
MANKITGKKLLEAIQNNDFMENNNIENCDGSKYDFVLGESFLKSSFLGPKQYEKLTPEEKLDAVVLPGEAVFVMAAETLHLPRDVYGELSHKRKMTKAGIMVLGGWAIDPGYQGKLVFCLYNFSAEPFPLIPGRKLMGAVFYRHTQEEMEDLQEYSPPEPITDFSSDLIERVRKFRPTSVEAIREQVTQLFNRVESMDRDIKHQEISITDLRNLQDQATREIRDVSQMVKDMANSVSDLKDALGKEIECRKDGDQKNQVKLLEETIARKEEDQK